MINLVIDFETRSRADLQKVGAFNYAMHHSTEILCMAYSIDFQEPKILKFKEELPADFLKIIRRDDFVIHAHNSFFEYCIWNFCQARREKWPRIPIEFFEDTAARCAVLALPRSLEGVGEALNLSKKKDLEGRRIMLKMSKPRRETLKDKSPWHEKPEDFETLYKYCLDDVRAEIEVIKNTPPLSPTEKEIFLLDQKINLRGVKCDVHAAKTASLFLEQYGRDLLSELKNITGGEVSSAQEIAKMKNFLVSQGVGIPSLDAKTVKEFLPKTNGAARRVLEIRQALSKSSVKKLVSMISMSSEDNRIRGTLLYHGSATGRWSGKGIQPQNFPRGELKDIETARKALSLGYDFFSDLYPNVTNVVSSLLRTFLVADKNKEFLVSDYSAIEARVLLWASKDERGLKIFKEGGDIYKDMASTIYKIPMAQVNKDQRQIGKIACIAEGELVLTDSGLVPIEKISTSHKVWDGVEWVSHDGVVLNGKREVITYEGLTATKDHLVWTNEGRALPFGVCSSKGLTLAKTGFNGEALRFSKDNFTGRNEERKIFISKSSLLLLFRNKVNRILQPFIGKIERVSKMLQTEASPKVVNEKSRRHETTLRQSKKPRVERLRRTWDRISISISFTRRSLDTKKSRFKTWFRDRSNRQQWPLLPGKFTLCYAGASNPKQESEQINPRPNRLGEKQRPFFVEYFTKINEGGGDDERDNKKGGAGLFKKAEELERDKREIRKVNVYDILNAGPRNRFTVSGVLVHNCLALGYGMGANKFKKTCEGYGIEVNEAQALKVVSAYRQKYSSVVNFWYAMERAAKKAVKFPGVIEKVNNFAFKSDSNYLFLKLPSGRKLAYKSPRISFDEYGEKLNYMGLDTYTHKWSEQNHYGGSLVENAIQAVARDLMADAMLRAEEKDMKVVLTVHDELVCEVREGQFTPKDLEDLMKEVPAWAQGLPINAEGWSGKFYRK